MISEQALRDAIACITAGGGKVFKRDGVVHAYVNVSIANGAVEARQLLFENLEAVATLLPELGPLSRAE